MHVGPYCISYVCTRVEIIRSRTTFFIAFGDSMPACFDTIGKGMDTVPTRFDALQFKISEIFSR